MKIFRNRTVIGVLCILLALIICFGVTPLFSRSASEKTEIVRVTMDIKEGDEITAEMVQTVEVGAYNLPQNLMTDKKEVVGKYATADLAAGDYILSSKLSAVPAAENAYLYNLDGTKQAISVTIKSFAVGLSGKLESGDIVTVIVADYQGKGETAIPPELQYVEVISVTASSGYDANTGEVVDEKELPSTVTLLVTTEQAKVLAELEQDKDGIAAMRSKLTNAIFRDEMQQIYERKDAAYSDLVEAAQNAMREMISRMQHQICDSPIIEDNMRQLVQALETTTGKKQYGYLKKPLKQLVDTIVDMLAELPEVSECYEVWNQIHEELNECYGHSTPWERIPLSQRKEFRKIKNDIIREAENIRLGLPTFEDERMQDEPEPENQKEEHQSYSVYEQAQRYRAAKAVLQDIYALDAEHAEAVKALEQLWEEGYTVAAHQLGKFYRDDLSTLRDHEKAEEWFRRSAEAGNDFSEYALGKLLLTQKRWEEALGWLGKAADHGNQFARYRLGKIYLAGESVPKDVAKALAYLTASADQGNQFAQYTLGKLYLLGRDVPPDREQAREWLIRAAAQGNEYARFFLDHFDQFRDPSVMLAASKLLHHMSRIFQNNSIPPVNPAGIRIDSKRRRRLMEKRMAMGHKADDHEEQTQYQQSM